MGPPGRREEEREERSLFRLLEEDHRLFHREITELIEALKRCLCCRRHHRDDDDDRGEGDRDRRRDRDKDRDRGEEGDR